MSAKNTANEKKGAGEILEQNIEESDFESLPLASAKSIARPKTSLPVRPSGKIGKMRVSILNDPSSVPSLDEIDRINKSAEAPARTPLMTVIMAIIAHMGGNASIEEIAGRIKKHWNRQLPSTPYTLEEFVFLVVRSSDSLRLS
jgi:hypothetical protein